LLDYSFKKEEMDWLHQKLASQDTSLPARNLKLFQEQADLFLRKKLNLTLEQFLIQSAPAYVQTMRRYYEYYNIIQFCIESQPLWEQNGIQFPLIPFPTPDINNWTLVAKRAIYLALLNHPFTFSIAETGLHYRIALVVNSNEDMKIPTRKNRAMLTPTEVQEEMEFLFVWADSFFSK
jgi:hypothetical protein